MKCFGHFGLSLGKTGFGVHTVTYTVNLRPFCQKRKEREKKAYCPIKK